MEVEERQSSGVLRRLSRYAGNVAGGVAVLGSGVGHACDRSAKAVGCMLTSGKKQEDECCSEDAAPSVVEEPVSKAVEESAEVRDESEREETTDLAADVEVDEPSDTTDDDSDDEEPSSS